MTRDCQGVVTYVKGPKMELRGHEDICPTHVLPTFLHELLDFSAIVPNVVTIINFYIPHLLVYIVAQ